MDDFDLAKEITHQRNPVRIINLTDAVFAIIMTILVLEIKIPDEPPHSIQSMLSVYGIKILAYIMSFSVTAVYWMSHKLIFANVKKINTTILWLNIIYLMVASLIPFVAGLIGTFPFEENSLILYAIILTLLATLRLIMYTYITSKKELLYSSVSEKIRSQIMKSMALAALSFFASIFVSLFYPKIAFILCALTPILFMILVTIVSRHTSKENH